MERLCMFALAAALVCLPGLGRVRAGDRPATGRGPSLGQVKKIYVGDMGGADEAERFRLLLEGELDAQGFTVVGDPAEADAVLTGALSVRVYDHNSEARAIVKLVTPGGRRLWGRDFGHKRVVNPFSQKEPTQRRAEEIAEALHRDWIRAARVAP